jgi:hypothetical protein
MNPGPIAPNIDNTNKLFTAGAGGVISNSANTDGWSINQKRQLVWTQDGV